MATEPELERDHRLAVKINARPAAVPRRARHPPRRHEARVRPPSRHRSCSATRSAPTPAASGTGTTREKLDKDRFRRDLGGVEEAYHESAPPGAPQRRRSDHALARPRLRDAEARRPRSARQGDRALAARARLRGGRRGATRQVHRAARSTASAAPGASRVSTRCASGCSPTGDRRLPLRHRGVGTGAPR